MDQLPHSSASMAATSTFPPPTASQKKRRYQKTTGNIEVEVIQPAVETLLVDNMFICEVCGKSFNRKQNLTVHNRGHISQYNLNKNKKKDEEKPKSYICPEENCSNHSPSRALVDLRALKKHYKRKHLEKTLQCKRCKKSYAISSDLNAHSRICSGVKEYKCYNCGSDFLRIDSFLNHQKICCGLTQQSTSEALSTINSFTTTTSSLENNRSSSTSFLTGNSFPTTTSLFENNFSNTFSFPTGYSFPTTTSFFEDNFSNAFSFPIGNNIPTSDNAVGDLPGPPMFDSLTYHPTDITVSHGQQFNDTRNTLPNFDLENFDIEFPYETISDVSMPNIIGTVLQQQVQQPNSPSALFSNSGNLNSPCPMTTGIDTNSSDHGLINTNFSCSFAGGNSFVPMFGSNSGPYQPQTNHLGYYGNNTNCSDVVNHEGNQVSQSHCELGIDGGHFNQKLYQDTYDIDGFGVAFQELQNDISFWEYLGLEN